MDDYKIGDESPEQLKKMRQVIHYDRRLQLDRGLVNAWIFNGEDQGTGLHMRPNRELKKYKFTATMEFATGSSIELVTEPERMACSQALEDPALCRAINIEPEMIDTIPLSIWINGVKK